MVKFDAKGKILHPSNLSDSGKCDWSHSAIDKTGCIVLQYPRNKRRARALTPVLAHQCIAMGVFCYYTGGFDRE